MKKKFPLVSVIVVNWNGGQVFEDCLESLVKIKYPQWELIVVDNGSSDRSEWLSQNYALPCKNYQLVKNQRNLGFARANNQGYKRARGEYILLLNNDTLVTPDFLGALVGRMEQERRLGVVQPKIFLMDRPGYLDNAGTFLTWTGFLQHWGFMQKDGAEFSREREILSTKGACMLIRKEVIDKVELFDGDFISYFEETDFCWRAWLAGYRVLYFPEIYIYHKVGATSKKMDQTTINYHSFKNRVLSLIKNLGVVNLFFILLPHLTILCILGLFYVLKLQFSKSKMIYAAMLWNVFHLPSTLKKRSSIQNMRKKTDPEIFEKIYRKIDFRQMFLHFGRVEANFSR